MESDITRLVERVAGILIRFSMARGPLLAMACAALFIIPAQEGSFMSAPPASAADRAGSAAPPARMQPRPVFALACPTDTPELTVLCRTLQNALAVQAPEYAFRRVATLDQAPEGVKNMVMALEVERMDAHEIAARLVWKGPKMDTPQAGPLIAMSVQDAELSPRMFPDFVAALLRASDLPLKE